MLKTRGVISVSRSRRVADQSAPTTRVRISPQAVAASRIDEPGNAADSETPRAADVALMRAVAAGDPIDHHMLNAGSVQTLQRAYGNQAVQRILGKAARTDDREASDQPVDGHPGVSAPLQ